MMSGSSRNNNAVNFRLRELGFSDRDDWRFIALDNRLFDGGAIVAKPDFAVRHKYDDHLVVVEYKDRKLGATLPMMHETYQTIITGLVVKYDLEQVEGKEFSMRYILLYGDGKKVEIYDVNAGDVDAIAETALEFSTPDCPISASKLAIIMGKESFEHASPAARAIGKRSHNFLIDGAISRN